MRPPEDLVGKRFGRLTVVAEIASRTAPNGERVRRFQCNCACGGSKIVSAIRLRDGTQSCGCLQRERSRDRIAHGETRQGRQTPEYMAWSNMIRRCTDPDHPRYADYGGRGITVCDRWRRSFPDFLSDVGRRPSPDHSIDRFPNNDGGYEPGNVRWATVKQQNQNKRPRRRAS